MSLFYQYISIIQAILIILSYHGADFAGCIERVRIALRDHCTAYVF